MIWFKKFIKTTKPDMNGIKIWATFDSEISYVKKLQTCNRKQQVNRRKENEGLRLVENLSKFL